MSTFNRSEYYSQTDVLRLFKISRVKYHALLKERNLNTLSVTIDMGDYTMVTKYVKREIIDNLGLEKRVTLGK